MITGNGGTDEIAGGAGDDDITGDGDVFVFDGFNFGEVDRITNFEDGVDMIRLVGVEDLAH